MTFDDVEAFVDALDEHEKSLVDLEVARAKSWADFATQLTVMQTKTIASALGARVG